MTEVTWILKRTGKKKEVEWARKAENETQAKFSAVGEDSDEPHAKNRESSIGSDLSLCTHSSPLREPAKDHKYSTSLRKLSSLAYADAKRSSDGPQIWA